MAIIYGYISSSAADDKALSDFNKAVLQRLPQYGSYICRDMFAMLPFDNRALCKYSYIIHFAAEYDEMYVMPDDWLEEFESLLSQLYWNHVNVIETYSGNRFVWRADECGLEKISAITKWNRIVFESYHYLREIEY
ncbi:MULTISPECIES: hypothetical protein [unclassified Gilliamella]|uniref:hypothetical protein n=1 Tax=unclassified Gilliamella TaxID=2685620 RepID=UPI000A35B9D8|nr:MULTISPECIES: hypothetical protein [unclassified Gilliamella]OTQ73787.1 hypothetical protein B6C99_06755 [Gilliamella sp. N-G2]OTQ77538.1 hypothetical protein B6D23_11370 [Gilliamella sp. N-W3]